MFTRLHPRGIHETMHMSTWPGLLVSEYRKSLQDGL